MELEERIEEDSDLFDVVDTINLTEDQPNKLKEDVEELNFENETFDVYSEMIKESEEEDEQF